MCISLQIAKIIANALGRQTITLPTPLLYLKDTKFLELLLFLVIPKSYFLHVPVCSLELFSSDLIAIHLEHNGNFPNFRYEYTIFDCSIRHSQT